MAEFFFLGFQVSDISRMRRDLDRHPRDVYSITAQAFYLVWIVGQQLHLADAEIAQYLRADPVVAQVLVEAEMQVCFDGVHPVVLQRVGANLVAQPDAATLLVEINHDASIRRHNSLERLLQLLTAVASRRREHVAGEALRMEPHERRAPAADLALDQSEMLAAIDDVAENDGLQHAPFDRKRLLGDALDQDFIRQAMRNEFLDVNDRDRMLRREFAEFAQARRLTVLAQNGAQRRDRAHSRRAHQVHRAL